MTAPLRVAIACGGTGGHVFPGLAVAEQLVRRGAAVTLLISPKEVDQQAVQKVFGLSVAVLPAAGWSRGGRLAFLRGFVASLFVTWKLFRAQRPRAVLAMGGFTAVPPVLVARWLGIPAFLHESNTIPGRANRWLARLVRRAFVGFPEAAGRLSAARPVVTGTPVRPQFQPRDPAACRAALGLRPDRPVVLVMGGSQGASGINQLVIESLPLLRRLAPDWQWLHLTGARDFSRVSEAHRASGAGAAAVVREFLAEMELALGAATVAVSRAGASSLAELAALRVPAVLIPYPAATDNHQWHNAAAFASAHAARVLTQTEATPAVFVRVLQELVGDEALREQLKAGLARWHQPDAAVQIAEAILATVRESRAGAPCEHRHDRTAAADDPSLCRLALHR